MAILILGNPSDDHASHVYQYLTTQGKDVEFLDSQAFPADLRVSYNPLDPSGSFKLPTGLQLGFNELTSVYWRNYGGVGCAALPDPGQSYIAQNDSRSLFESLLINLPARWVNGWRAFQLHQTKPVQLAMVAALGVATPATLLSNDPHQVAQFAEQHAKCIFKPVQGGAHTDRVTATHLTETNLANLSFAPVTVQEEVPGTNVRVFVAGERVLACEFQTDSLDYRDDPDPRIKATELPNEVKEQCRRIARTLDLLWTGIDLRRTPEGGYVFLEANPSPMFLGFEERTGLPLTEALVRLLTG